MIVETTSSSDPREHCQALTLEAATPDEERLLAYLSTRIAKAGTITIRHSDGSIATFTIHGEPSRV